MIVTPLVVLGLFAAPVVPPNSTKFEVLYRSTSGRSALYIQREPEKLSNGRFHISVLAEDPNDSYVFRFEVDCEARRVTTASTDFFYEKRMPLWRSWDRGARDLSEGAPIYDRTCLR